MSLDFVKSGKNRTYLNKAVQQEEQLSYLTQSRVQDTNLSTDYLTNWAERNFETNDFFLNYIKSIFKPENFLAFYKYLRFPLPSSKLVQNKIKPNLKRVFHSENSHYKYDVTGVDNSVFMPFLKVKEFNEELFNAILFKHNSIIVSDLEDVNIPFREIINIKDVVAIDGDDIDRIAFKAEVEIDGVEYCGHLYIDEERYCFYDDKEIERLNIPHDLGECPAHFIVNDSFANDCFVKASIFSHIREELEEYNFLKTLQKMTEPNGAIPITIKLAASVFDDNQDKQVKDNEPNSDNVMGSQTASQFRQTAGKSKGVLQAGTVIEVPQIRLDSGALDMNAVQEFLRFIYIPVEALDYLDKRIRAIENSIISTIIGDVVSSNEKAKNETQVEKSISVLEDNLRYLSETIGRVRRLSDTDMLCLAYGKERVNEVSIFYGSDFFLENESTLYDMFSKAPNTIERKNTLIKISQNRYKHNLEQAERQKLLYNLMPFCSDKDFEYSKDKIDPIIYEYQTRFNYWISNFEAEYGDIVIFFNSMNVIDSQRYLAINNLIIEQIKKANEDNKNQIV